MPWSKSFLSKEAAESRVLEYVPQKLDMGTPTQALQYLDRKHGSDFRMNDQVQIHTGVDKIERANHEEHVEERAIEMLAEVQKSAYQEAYNLGLDEGRTKAFEDASSMINAKMEEFSGLLNTLANMKTEIMAHNESHMVKLMYHMASKIAMKHLDSDDDAVLEVLRSAVSLAQNEEEMTVQMNPEQIEFVEELRQKTGREFEFMKKIRFQPSADVSPGGCIVETNYGEIDARVETRLQQLWDTLTDVAPKVKDKIAG